MFHSDVFDSGHYGLFQEARPTPLREAVPELPRRETLSHTADSVLAETAIPERKPSNKIDLSQDPTARLQKMLKKSKGK